VTEEVKKEIEMYRMGSTRSTECVCVCVCNISIRDEYIHECVHCTGLFVMPTLDAKCK
jgi:hypothetical protein